MENRKLEEPGNDEEAPAGEGKQMWLGGKMGRPGAFRSQETWVQIQVLLHLRNLHFYFEDQIKR